jgi:hypothetical protein
MDDTSADASAIVLDAVRRTPPVERMRRALAHSEAMRALALARLRARHPGRPTIELVEILLGDRLRPREGGPDSP